ncbi:uncharacterized protein [Drosophila kikkawai]|uniref:Integrase zinc-binding domain-containing protein n=1 Tax=Drosophila kikkawai TaxID=30033 RepID=A0ABM3C8D1_DROKI|nr:uncharacterized protein LOC121503191 [Drosophila kikkawai]
MVYWPGIFIAAQWPSRTGVHISSECELMYHDEETWVNKSPFDSIMPDPLRSSRLERLRAAQRRVLDFLRCICKEPQRIEAIEDVEANVKHPIVLPSRYRVTYLIVGYYHRKYHHLHGKIVVNEIRQQYWIPGLRALVKDIVKNCSACCIRFHAQPLPPIMGNLPKERLLPFTLPFTYTGVDYFGPMEIAVGRHSFLLALKLFTARRGVPVKMLSDNGTNFRGASRVLAKEIERILTSDVKSKYPEMSFAFIPPGTPHMGGAWERKVRSTKSILTGLRERGTMESTGLGLAKNFRIAGQLADRF